MFMWSLCNCLLLAATFSPSNCSQWMKGCGRKLRASSFHSQHFSRANCRTFSTRYIFSLPFPAQSLRSNAVVEAPKWGCDGLLQDLQQRTWCCVCCGPLAGLEGSGSHTHTHILWGCSDPELPFPLYHTHLPVYQSRSVQPFSVCLPVCPTT
jgi:hypothetical protein